jgi:hypothetical protein
MELRRWVAHEFTQDFKGLEAGGRTGAGRGTRRKYGGKKGGVLVIDH